MDRQLAKEAEILVVKENYSIREAVEKVKKYKEEYYKQCNYCKNRLYILGNRVIKAYGNYYCDIECIEKDLL